LGDGAAVIKRSPVRIGSATNWVTVAVGGNHTVGLQADGTLWAWGDNGDGQLGDGTTVDKRSPVRIGSATNWVTVAAGGYHTVGLQADGTLWAWGYNSSGQLGDGTTVNKSSPVRIGSATNWVTVAAYYHTVGLQADGTLWAWGYNYYGQLGDGTTVNRSSPEKIGVPVIVTQPVSHTTGTGTAVTFSGGAAGSKPLSYQWRKDGMNLTDGPRITGSTEADLALSNVQLVDGGNYTLTVSNAYGTVTTSNAMLNVMELPPMITAHPLSRQVVAESSVTFSVSATGSMPLLFEWRKDSAPLAGATQSSFTISNVLKSTEGAYCVVVNNLHGSVTSTVATLTVIDPAILVQPASQKVELGDNATISITAAGTPPVAYQWWKDGDVLAGATGNALVLPGVGAEDNGQYHVVVSNPVGSVTSALAMLTVNLATNDPGFNPGADNTVHTLAVQADEKILVGGEFSTLGGRSRYRIGRLHPDGTVDTAFNPGGNNAVYALAVQADGRTLIGGTFTNLGGQVRSRIARLNANGALDSGFNPGANNSVSALALQPDGRILVGGSFTNVGGQARSRIARLNADGTVDNDFNPGANNSVSALLPQADGRILVAGSFTNLVGQPRSYLGRLHADGTLDQEFNPGANSSVSTLALQADGKILVGGGFTNLAGQARSRIARLNPDGTLDSEFNPGADGTVSSLVVQTDAKILVAGEFSQIGGQSRRRIGRLHPDGTVDPTFAPSGLTYSSDRVYALALQADGSILLGGNFDFLNDQIRSLIARLHNTEPGTSSLTCDGSTITWLRGGAGPEVGWTVFESSSDGVEWTRLGAGARITGGWQLNNVLLPPGATLRARGVVALTDSFYWVVAGPPILLVQPLSRTNDATTAATFTVVAEGPEPLSFQWLKDGSPFANSGNINGAMTPTLTLTNVLSQDQGGYRIVVANAYGSTTSAVAALVVRDPVITGNPVSQVREFGQSVTFSVGAAGTPPFSYQWWKDGVALAGATGNSLTLTNLQWVNAGKYQVVVSSSSGSITSSLAALDFPVTVESGFDPQAEGTWAPNVDSILVQPDGKIVVAGDFVSLGGEPRTNLARLHPDGTLDTQFNPGSDNGVWTLALQTDGKILVGGNFTTLGRQPRNYLGRLHADGTLDETFSPVANSWVRSLALQADGKILVGGDFTALGGQPRSRIGRLNADGTLDSAFNPGVSNSSGFPSSVSTLALQPDGKILVSGAFTSLGGQSRDYLGRLNPDGTLDSFFNPAIGTYLNTMAVQADGKILVGGDFATFRLNPDGTPDSLFHPPAMDWSDRVETLVVQADGRILVGGYFSRLAGQPRSNLGRLHPDGTVDESLNVGDVNSQVSALALQEDGKILVGGVFDSVEGYPRYGIARLQNSAPAPRSLDFDGSTITWSRSGAGPEVWRTSFDYLSGEGTWTGLGAGTRIPGGWQLTGVSLPPGAPLRARGHTVGGYQNASGWFVETYYGSPVILAQPANQDTPLGTTASLAVRAGGSEPLGLQWFRDGVPLADAGRVSGAWTSSLSLLNSQKEDEGHYRVVVTNLYGSVTSSVAILTVIDPAILTPPASQEAEAGQSVTFTVTAAGTPPLSCQWWKDGTIVFGATGDSLTLLDLGPQHNGDYRVVVSNPLGSVTSSVASLTVTASLGEALDAPHLTWTTGDTEYYPPSLPWFGQTKVMHDGQDAAQSGGIRDRKTWIETTVTGPGELSFWWKVFGQSPCTSIDLIVNEGWSGVYISGKTDWQRRVVALGDGAHVLRWVHETCSDIEPYPDQAWVDQVTFIPSSGAAVVVTPPQSQTVALGSAATFTVVAGGAAPLNFAWLKDGAPVADGTNVVGALTPTLTLSNLLPDDAGSFQVVVSNALGVVTSAVATLTILDPAIVIHPANQTGNAGQNVTLSVTAAGTPPFAYQWWKEANPLPEATGTSLTLANVQSGDAGSYRVVVGNPYGSVTSAAALLTVNLATLDAGFNPRPSDSVYALALLPEGKILVGGRFSRMADVSCGSLARLNADGTRDTNFNPQASGTVYVVAAQPDGDILVAGNLSYLGGQPRGRIGRVHGDGALDATFNPTANELVHALALQADGKILVGGGFWELAGESRANLARLYPNGALDFDFNPQIDGRVRCLAVQPDGKILVGGSFSSVGGEARYNLARLNADGTVDNGFTTGAGHEVWSLALQADGKILVGGLFTALGGQPRNCLGRLNPDGTLDASFTTGVEEDDPTRITSIHSLAVQTDGKILVGGFFTRLGGQPRYHLGRLHSDGTLDPDFNPGLGSADPVVYGLAIQPDGRILVGGGFSTLAGQSINDLGRLNNTGPETQSFTYERSTLAWLRGGTGPEIWRTSFEVSTDGANWTQLGEGSRIPGGWQLKDVSLPPASTIRARGYVTGGQDNGSSGFVETLWVPTIDSRPVLIVESIDGPLLRFKLTGATNAVYSVETTLGLAPVMAWKPFTSLELTNGWSRFHWTNTGEAQRFFRALGP